MNETEVLINLTQSLLDNIVQGNWEAYEELCDPSLTCFEPEALGHLVEGLGFHQFYFDIRRPNAQRSDHQTTLASPHVRILGDVGIVSYVRLSQYLDGDGAARSTFCEETRVWHKQNGAWKHVHFHRSLPTA